MFDGAGRLVCEPNLAAAQALCLLQMHDILTKEPNAVWGSRYHDLAYRIVEALGVHSPEHPTLTPVPSPEFISASLEREAIRRIFWYIHLIDVKASIYFKKPITFTAAELRLRLPVDETSFELGVHSTLPGASPPLFTLIPFFLVLSFSLHCFRRSTFTNHRICIEYLHLPAVRTQYASEFGHLIRIMTIYAKVELIIDNLNGKSEVSLLLRRVTYSSAILAGVPPVSFVSVAAWDPHFSRSRLERWGWGVAFFCPSRCSSAILSLVTRKCALTSLSGSLIPES